MKIWLGIDPGASGAIAAILETDAPCIAAVPAFELPMAGWVTVEFRKLDDPVEAMRWMEDDLGVLNPHRTLYASIEKINARLPKNKDGSTNYFSFSHVAKLMEHYGWLQGLLDAWPVRYERVTPQTWQRAMGCMTKGDKNVSKKRAQELFPGVRITHANADALLIAEYCRRTCH